jgi:hypothetical protein
MVVQKLHGYWWLVHVPACQHCCTTTLAAKVTLTATQRQHTWVQAARDAATWTGLGGRKVVSAANAASHAEEKHAVESDDEADDELVSHADLLHIPNKS